MALAGLYDETSQPDGLELGHGTEASLQKGRNNFDAQGKELELEELDKHYLEGLLQGGEAAEGPGHRVGPGQGRQSSDLLLQKRRNYCDARRQELELEEADKHYLEGLREGGGAAEGAEGPGHRVGAGQGRHSSSAQGGKLFCVKTRKLRNVARDTLRQLSLKNFTVQTFQNYGGGAPGENDKGLELNSNLEESEHECRGPGRGYRIMNSD